MIKYTCFFAHYNSRQTINRSVQTYVMALDAIGVQIVFISNSKINSSGKNFLAGIPGVVKVIERENLGNDFGAWQEGIRNYQLKNDCTHVLFANDSVFGPIGDLAAMLQKMANETVDFWGVTDSYQHGWHLQSYFLCFAREVFDSDGFRSFFTTNFNALDKAAIISTGEIGLTSALIDSGFKPGCVVSSVLLQGDSAKDKLLAHNVTHYYWKELITKHSVPFLKKEVLLRNPEGLSNVGELLEFVDLQTNYNILDVEEYVIESCQTLYSSTSEQPVCVLCHLYYPHMVYDFLQRLSVLKSFNSRFIFNVATTLQGKHNFVRILQQAFPGSIILFSSDQGRDIGGKMVTIDAMIRNQISSEVCLVIHDKFSPHTELGMDWRNKLLQIIKPGIIEQVLQLFRAEKVVGLVGATDFLHNEFDRTTNTFTGNNNHFLHKLLEKYQIRLKDYTFLGGTIFWIRTSIVESFFNKYAPLDIRKELERGNVLDFERGSNVHSWERMFSFIVQSEGYKLKGIN